MLLCVYRTLPSNMFHCDPNSLKTLMFFYGKNNFIVAKIRTPQFGFVWFSKPCLQSFIDASRPLMLLIKKLGERLSETQLSLSEFSSKILKFSSNLEVQKAIEIQSLNSKLRSLESSFSTKSFFFSINKLEYWNSNMKPLQCKVCTHVHCNAYYAVRCAQRTRVYKKLSNLIVPTANLAG